MRESRSEHTRRFVLRWVGEKPRRIVQLEAGRGDICLALVHAGHRVVCLDRDPAGAGLARERALAEGLGGRFLVADAQRGIPVRGEIDRLLILDCWERFSRPLDVMRSARAVMRLGGRVLIVTRNRWLPPPRWILDTVCRGSGGFLRHGAAYPRPVSMVASATGFRLTDAFPLYAGSALAMTLIREDPEE